MGAFFKKVVTAQKGFATNKTTPFSCEMICLVFSGYDVDGDGQITIAEFKRVMKK